MAATDAPRATIHGSPGSNAKFVAMEIQNANNGKFGPPTRDTKSHGSASAPSGAPPMIPWRASVGSRSAPMYSE